MPHRDGQSTVWCVHVAQRAQPAKSLRAIRFRREIRWLSLVTRGRASRGPAQRRGRGATSGRLGRALAARRGHCLPICPGAAATRRPGWGGAARRTRSLRRTTDSGRGSSRCGGRSEEHTSELQSRENLVCRLLLEKKKNLKMKHRRVYTKLKKSVTIKKCWELYTGKIYLF